MVVIVQLPFPAMGSPDAFVDAYYRTYGQRFSELVDYFVPEGDLWELPLWVAHLGGMLNAVGAPYRFVDLAREPASPGAVTAELVAASDPGDVLLMSPLAQNFDLTVEVSRRLLEAGRRTVMGGNMAPLVREEDAHHVHLGVLTEDALRGVLHGGASRITATPPRRGRGGRTSTVPDYAPLTRYRERVPLLRLNASHGCLFRCNFCGDAWSRQLYVVDRDALEAEVRQLEDLFPEARLIYVGDKTFGQSREAIANLLAVFASRREYRFIVQTHVLQITDEVVDAMVRLGVVVAELGFETADVDALRESDKAVRDIEHYASVIEKLTAAGIRVVLNVLGGLPNERRESHEHTLAFLESRRNLTWLYNLYSFVPYPLTPLFEPLRPRIRDWNFANWREDSKPVFDPYFLTADESFELFREKVEVAHGLISRGASPGAHRADRALAGESV